MIVDKQIEIRILGKGKMVTSNTFIINYFQGMPLVLQM